MDHEKKVITILGVSTAIIFLATAAVFVGIWLNYDRDLAKNVSNQAATTDENGMVLGASTDSSTPVDQIIDLTKKLKNQGFILYGDDNGADTLKQKNLFGQSFENIDYVDCNAQVVNSNPDECAAKNITVYPTWICGENVYTGYKNFFELSDLVK